MTQPIIGLTTIRAHDTTGIDWRYYYFTNESYINAVLEAGGIPVLIPLNVLKSEDTRLLRAIYERVDGILIPGGGDIHPENYHEQPTGKEENISLERDAVEILLAKWAYEDDRPLLGICRGQQVINVALGGTLVHDLPSEHPDSPLTHDQDLHIVPSVISHQVEIQYDSKLGEILGKHHLEVNSLHHQAVEKLAEPLRVTAYADDGTVEGVEVPNATFYMGVQWHPEWLTNNVPEMQNLFKAFIAACAERAQARVE